VCVRCFFHLTSATSYTIKAWRVSLSHCFSLFDSPRAAYKIYVYKIRRELCFCCMHAPRGAEQEEGAHRHNHDYSLPCASTYILMVKNAQAHLRRRRFFFCQFNSKRNRLNLPAAAAFALSLMCVTCARLHIINTAQDVFDLQPGGSEFIVFMCVPCAHTRASRRPSRKELF
jgi:hypothetical protein